MRESKIWGIIIGFSGIERGVICAWFAGLGIWSFLGWNIGSDSTCGLEDLKIGDLRDCTPCELLSSLLFRDLSEFERGVSLACIDISTVRSVSSCQLWDFQKYAAKVQISLYKRILSNLI